jgi:8-oxo-dGTP diphosphatase
MKTLDLPRRIGRVLRNVPPLFHLAFTVFRWQQARFTAGVVGVVLDAQRRVLLVEHVFHPEMPWGLPGGWLDRDEAPAVGAVRELREELQLTVQCQQVLLVDLPYPQHLDFAYLCVAQGQIGALSSELISYRWADAQTLPPLKPFHHQAILKAWEITTDER